MRDEGRAWYAALTGAGISAELLEYEDTIHGFLSMGRFIPLAREALHDAALATKKLLDTNVR